MCSITLQIEVQSNDKNTVARDTGKRISSCGDQKTVTYSKAYYALFAIAVSAGCFCALVIGNSSGSLDHQDGQTPENECNAKWLGKPPSDVGEFFEGHHERCAAHPQQVHGPADKANNHQAPTTRDTVNTVMKPHSEPTAKTRPPMG